MLVAILAYSPALTGPFLYDDGPSILDNASIQRLWPLSVPLDPPKQTPVSGRPVVNYSLALNYALNDALGVDQRADPMGPYKTVSYRVVNILLHLACGALLCGILRRTLRGRPSREPWAAIADPAALLITGLWLLHPIQSEAVIYITQRTELIVSGCYLATLYASIRAWDARGRAAGAWYAAAVVACLLGMGSKEVMITAPIIVVLYDRAFRRSSWAITRPRALFYLALAATSIWAVVLELGRPRSESVGWGLGITWYQYLYSQAWAISRYITLVFWPDRLTVDYGLNPIHGWGGVPGLVVLTAFAAATLLAWTQANRWGWFAFLGSWFFLLLAPSSSIVPIITEIAAERRIYLALAAVLVLLVVGAEWLRGRIAAAEGSRRRQLVVGVVAGIGFPYLMVSGWKAHEITSTIGLVWAIRLAAALGAGLVAWLIVAAGRWKWATVAIAALLVAVLFERSRTYGDAQTMMRDVVRKAPLNPRGYHNLGRFLLMQGPTRAAEAESLFRRAVAVDSTYELSWYGLAQIAMDEGRPAEAKPLLERALAINPGYLMALGRLGDLLVASGDPAQGIPYLERLAARMPAAPPLIDLGNAYLAVGRLSDAERVLRQAVDLAPDRPDALSALGAVLVDEGRAPAAVPYLEQSVMRQPNGLNLGRLSLAYAQVDHAPEAASAADLAAQRAGGDARVYQLLGAAMRRANKLALAEQYSLTAVRLAPTDPGAITGLGESEAALGNRDAAADLFRRALRARPGYGAAERGLAQLGKQP